MKVIAVNGSPRKKWNTATLLKKCLEGAKANGAEVKLVHLYELDYKGCVSCFKCKKIGGKSFGRCAVKDGLTPLLDEIPDIDALIVGSPIYFGAESGETRSFLERLLFPYVTYTPERKILFPKKIPTAMIYTMNIREEQISEFGYTPFLERAKTTLARVFGSCEILLCTDTFQFDDYSRYLSTLWNPEAKAKRRAEVFPLDCERAANLGKRLVDLAKS